MFCFVVYYLGHYPEVKQRLREELDAVLGKNLTNPVTSKDLDKLQYCDAVINEVNRHCPINGRVNSERMRLEVSTGQKAEGTSFQML